MDLTKLSLQLLMSHQAKPAQTMLAALLSCVPLASALVSAPLAARSPARVAAFASTTETGKVAVDPDTVDAARDALTKTVPPGTAENAKFKLDESVAAWRAFQASGPQPTAADNLREVAVVAGKIAAEGGAGMAYSLTHALRTGYFLGNALLGTLSFELAERSRGGETRGASEEHASVAGFGGPSSAPPRASTPSEGEAAASSTATTNPYQPVNNPSPFPRMLGINPEIASRLLLEAALVYQQDWGHVSAKRIKRPWDMTPGHRQTTPWFAARQTGRFVSEAIGTLARRKKLNGSPAGVWLGASPGMYPNYYRNDFHYQTDGWMSSASANVYETSTETLFLGRQDAMQRHSLLPLADFAKARAARTGGAYRPMRILEIACGTGRFTTFIRDNHPDADVTACDLSPFYLEAARENDKYWRERAGASRGTRVAPPPVTLVQAAAEDLPFDDAAFDAVVCVYLFHEVPKEARAKAAAEMCRVAAPGGIVVLTDSIQKGDRPVLDDQLGAFSYMNEPHYADYIRTDLSELYEAHGLKCDQKYVASTSKTLSFIKPDEEYGE